MYNENNDSDKTDETNEYSDSLNESSTNDTYGRTFKDYTYSAYDYTSFFDENYGNSSDNSDTTSDNHDASFDNHNTSDNLNDNFKTTSVPDNAEDNYFSTINNSHSVESDDKVSKAVDMNNDISPDSFESFDNLNTVDSYNAFNNSSPNPDNHNDTVSPDDDPTIYLDRFLEDSINNKQTNKNKYKYLNIPGFAVISIAILSFVFIFIGALTGSNIGLVLGPVIFVITFMSAILLDTFTDHKLSLFLINPNYTNGELPAQNLHNYLDLTNKTTFKARQPYCLTGPSFNVRPKSLCTKYAIITIILAFIAGNIFAYFKQGPELSKILMCDFVFIFPCIGIILLYSCLNEYILIKSGYYNENVDAVCVEVDSRRTRRRANGGHSTIVYCPILYARCNNGHKYILFNNSYTNTHIPYIGEIIKLKVNSTNPINFIIEKPFYKNSFFIFSILWFSCSTFLYIFLVLFGTFQ